MSIQPGSLYKIGARRYIDSQALYNLAGTHEVVPQADGWRVLTAAGAVRCALVEGRPDLPRQRGALYELRAEGRADLKAERAAWLARGHLQPAGTFERWPDAPAAKAGCGCGVTCGCGPCRLRHGHAPHEHA